MKWFLQDAPENSIVLSSRVRLARNWRDMPFPQRMDDGQIAACCNRAREVLCSDNTQLQYVALSSLSPIDRQALVERHVISPALVESAERAALIVSPDEDLSVMVLEEDHLRIQAFEGGMQLEKAYQAARVPEGKLCPAGMVAFDDKLGYLTACPTNVGTGMRASLLMHLPGLTLSGQIEALQRALSKIGLTVRGLYGEGSTAAGHFYQISNQVTLGLSEEDILATLSQAGHEVLDLERQARQSLKENKGLAFEDQLMRSVGILQQARMLSSAEFMQLLSMAMLAADLKLYTPPQQDTLRRLMLTCQAAGIQKTAGKPLDETARDALRAKIVREALAHK
nr:protein arginine kinase [bacterium]